MYLSVLEHSSVCVGTQVENVECMPGDHIKFDFLGKDSIRYENEVVVHPKVYELIKKFCHQTAAKKRKSPLAALRSYCPALCVLMFTKQVIITGSVSVCD